MRSGAALEAKAVPQGGAPSVTGSTSSGSRSRSERCLRSWMPHRRRSQCALLRGWPVLGPLRQSAAAAALNRPPPRRQPFLTGAPGLAYVKWLGRPGAFPEDGVGHVVRKRPLRSLIRTGASAPPAGNTTTWPLPWSGLAHSFPTGGRFAASLSRSCRMGGPWASAATSPAEVSHLTGRLQHFSLPGRQPLRGAWR